MPSLPEADVLFHLPEKPGGHADVALPEPPRHTVNEPVLRGKFLAGYAELIEEIDVFRLELLLFLLLLPEFLPELLVLRFFDFDAEFRELQLQRLGGIEDFRRRRVELLKLFDAGPVTDDRENREEEKRHDRPECNPVPHPVAAADSPECFPDKNSPVADFPSR